jgi:hypothetical protein
MGLRTLRPPASAPGRLQCLGESQKKELTYDERDKPMVRRRLKAAKRREQSGICPLCKNPLPDKYRVLDRFVAAAGYTAENTQLICQDCDVKTQASRGYA